MNYFKTLDENYNAENVRDIVTWVSEGELTEVMADLYGGLLTSSNYARL